MAYVGPWGTFYHIPKCGGVSLRYFLRTHFHDAGREIGNQHTPPAPHHDLKDAWTVVRHPAEWLLSYFAYIEPREWYWPECPRELQDLFSFADGMFWPLWVKAICERAPGAVGRMYDLYCWQGVKVYKLEEIDQIFDMPVGLKNVTEIKPVISLAQWQMICKAEADTLARFGYDDKPSGLVRR